MLGDAIVIETVNFQQYIITQDEVTVSAILINLRNSIIIPRDIYAALNTEYFSDFHNDEKQNAFKCNFRVLVPQFYPRYGDAHCVTSLISSHWRSFELAAGT